MRVSGEAAPLLTQQPFGTRGASLYVRDQLPIIYRQQRTVDAAPLVASGSHPYAASTVETTTRVAFEAGDAGDPISIDHDLSSFAPGVVYVDLRHCADHVENQGSRPQKLTLDAGGDPDVQLLGKAVSLGHEARSGGIVRFQFRFVAAAQGDQPATFELRRTAGPTIPSTISVTSGGTGVYTIDSVALDDSATYTFELYAINGATELLLLTYSDVQADATGPPAPANLTTEVV